jgi:hypothetical protein
LSDLRTLICEELDSHEAMTCIVYTDKDDRVRYECTCGDTSEDSGLLDWEWRVAHTTDVVMTILKSAGIDNMEVDA